MFRLLVLASFFLIVSARVGGVFYECSYGFKSFARETTEKNKGMSHICLGVVTPEDDEENLTPDQICEGQDARFAIPERLKKKIKPMLEMESLSMECSQFSVTPLMSMERLRDYVITTRDMNTDPALMKFELIFHPELELYSVPKRPTSSQLYEAYCPLFLKKQVWYDIPRWVDVKNCGTKKEIQENFGKDGRMSVVCAKEPFLVME